MKTIIFLLLLVVTQAFAQDAERIKGLESKLEKMTFLTWFHSEGFLVSCAFDPKSCDMTPAEVALVKKLGTVIPKSFKELKIKFLWEKDANGTFNIGGGAHRLAATGFKPGSIIYINKDLAIDIKKNKILPEADLFAILTHEYLHHLGLTDNDERVIDQLTAKVKKRMLELTETIDLSKVGLDYVRISVHHIFPVNQLTKFERHLRTFRILVESGDSIDFNWPYLSGAQGSNPAQSYEISMAAQAFPEKCRTDDYVQLMHISNLRWRNLPRPEDLYGAPIVADADFTLYCGATMETAVKIDHGFMFELVLEKRNGVAAFYQNAVYRAIADRRQTIAKPLKIQSVSTNTALIEDAGLWKGTAQVINSENVKISACEAKLTSNSFFKSRFYTDREHMPGVNCSVRRGNDNLWYVDFDYEVLSHFDTSEIYISKFYFTIDDEEVEVVPVFYPQLRIKSQSKDEQFKLEEVKILDSSKKDITSLGKQSWDISNDKVIFQFKFNYCKPSVIVFRFFIDFEFYKPGYTDTGIIASFDHPVHFDKANAQYKCENNKSTVTAEYLFDKKITPEVYRELRQKDVTTMKIKGVNMVTGDHRTHKFPFEAFDATVIWK